MRNDTQEHNIQHLYQEQMQNLKTQAETEARRKKLREQIELKAMAKDLGIDNNDWDEAFGD
jgi:hypothetical protein